MRENNDKTEVSRDLLIYTKTSKQNMATAMLNSNDHNDNLETHNIF